MRDTAFDEGSSLNQPAADPKPAEGKFSTTNIGAIAAAVLVVVGIGLAILIPRSPDEAAAYEINKRERKIEKLSEENAQLKQELHDLRDDYARMVAERRCEVIDGMDDCLEAGLTRPERFRESDAALVRAREAEKARMAAEAARTPPQGAAAGPAAARDEEGGIAGLLKALKGIPGVRTD